MGSEHIADAVIAKVDEDKRLVFGWASIIKDEEDRILLDRQDDFIDDEGELEKAAYAYVLNSRDGGEMHIRKGVSTMVESVVLTKEKQEALGIEPGTIPTGWWIGFRVNDDRVWDQVKKGDYQGFSVHGTGRRESVPMAQGTFTEVEKASPSKLSADVEEQLRMHGRNHTGKHMRLMREYMADGMSMDAAHEKALAEIGKGDDRPVVRVNTRLFSLLTKATQAKTAALMDRDDRPGHPFRGNQWTKG